MRKTQQSDAPESGHVKTNAELVAEQGTRAPKGGARPAARSNEHRAQYGNDAIQPPEEQQKDGAGMPPGYKPDTSVSVVASKDPDAPLMVKDENGTHEVSPANQNVGGNTLETLPKDHTYRDRVEAQARSLGIEFSPDWTLEYLLWVIRMRASS